MSAGLQLIAASLKDATKDKFFLVHLPDELFRGQQERDVAQFVRQHLIDTGVLPQPQTIEDECSVVLPATLEPPEFYLEKMRKRRVHDALKKALIDADDLLKNKNPEAALALVLGEAVRLQLTNNGLALVNFAQDGGQIVLNEYKKKLMVLQDYGLRLGWPSFDAMSGGLVGGDVVSIVGRTGSGKTYMGLHAAHHMWVEQKKTPLFVSMEMKPLPIMQRLAAMHTHKSATQIKHATLATGTYKKFQTEMKGLSLHGVPFWVLDGGLAATVQDIQTYAQQMKADMIFVDGAYMLKAVGGQRMNRWERVSETVEGLKVVAQKLNIPVYTSYQLNRDSKKKKSADEVGVEDISFSDTVGHVASVVLGLFEHNSVETIHQKHVRILKGREGEAGEFTINWRFLPPVAMDFTEVVPEDPAKMKFE